MFEAELTAAEVKAAAKRFGADLVGIGNMERWEGAPKQNDPRYIFPGAKSFIVFGFRIPRSSPIRSTRDTSATAASSA